MNHYCFCLGILAAKAAAFTSVNDVNRCFSNKVSLAIKDMTFNIKCKCKFLNARLPLFLYFNVSLCQDTDVQTQRNLQNNAQLVISVLKGDKQAVLR